MKKMLTLLTLLLLAGCGSSLQETGATPPAGTEAWAARQAQPILTVTGSRTLLSDAQRRALGIQSGPDGVAAFCRLRGQATVLFPGMNSRRERGTFAFSCGPAGLVGDWAWMQSDPRGWCPRPLLRPSFVSNEFDRDYAGGGTTLEADGRLYYFYHGENNFRLDPNPTNSEPGAGWSGLGMAVWDEAGQAFRRCGQVIGLQVPSGVGPEGNRPELCQQTSPMADEANAVYNPDDGYVYLFYSDGNPGGRPGDLSRVAVARCARSELSRGIFRKYYAGGWSEPGLGGRAAPLTPNGSYRSPCVIWLKERRCFAMALGQSHERITLRLSPDAVNWTEIGLLATARPGLSVLYPGLSELENGELQLTYTEVGKVNKALNWEGGATLELKTARLR